jgi:hypothetical protein
MIIVSENLVIEYKDTDTREENINQMVSEGFELIKKYFIMDDFNRKHIFAEFKNSRKGYVGLEM